MKNDLHAQPDLGLDRLLARPDVWQGRAGSSAAAGETTGFAELDAALAGGGWPRGALTELLPERFGIGELRLLMPMFARLSRGPRWVTWIDPPYVPYAAGLHAWGVDLAHTLVVHPRDPRERLWALEQALRSGTCAAVLAWPGRLDGAALRRLQLAAEAGDCVGLLLRGKEARQSPSPAALRLSLAARRGGLEAEILKQRGGVPDAPLHLPAARLFETMGHRAGRPGLPADAPQ
jgi:hypothetical protein